MKGDWKPIKDYPVEPGVDGAAFGPVVLARTEDKVPYLVRLAKGYFFICPGIPQYFGQSQCGFMTISNVVEFMDLPE